MTATATDAATDGYLPWPVAWNTALYGPSGFYRTPEGPAGHFRTACHAAGDLLAEALIRLALAAGCTAIVDVGAGRGELLRALHTCIGRPGANVHEGRAAQLPRLHGADVVPRPADLPDGIGWSVTAQSLGGADLDGALVVAWELLDVVPCPVLELDEDLVWRKVLVDRRTGRERLGRPAEADHSAWYERWWPLEDPEPGDRVEVGSPREDLWAGLTRKMAATPSGGLLVAIDYSHTFQERPRVGTLSGYRAGRLVPPVPDGTCDITAHVALDAVAARTAPFGGEQVLTVQAEALRALGVLDHLDAKGPDATSTGTSSGQGPAAPPQAPAPVEALSVLERAGRARELTDPHGLGGFGWLIHGVGRPVPHVLQTLTSSNPGSDLTAFP